MSTFCLERFAAPSPTLTCEPGSLVKRWHQAFCSKNPGALGGAVSLEKQVLLGPWKAGWERGGGPLPNPSSAPLLRLSL